MEILKITQDNIDEIKSLYGAFCMRAQEDFLFEIPPIPFKDFKVNFQSGFIEGYYLKNPEPQGFMIYSSTLNQAIEITLLYAKEQENDYLIKNALIQEFLKDIKQKHSDKIISYPMLGLQNNYAQDITNFNFKLVGEMILEFNFYNPISQVILKKSTTTELKYPYSIDCWRDIYKDDAAVYLSEEFSKLNDSKFDERFLSVDGSKDVLNNVTSGFYGKFLPQISVVLKHFQQPVGFCFVNMISDDTANISLIYLKKEHQASGLGALMLKKSIEFLKQEVDLDRINIKVLKATCDTENFAAIKTYRKLGFKEQTYYSHAYMKI